ncbi:Protein stand still [Camponotus japonicus]
MDSFPIQSYENKMETFETYNDSVATAANRQRDIVQTQPVNSQTSAQQIQVQSQENRDTLALQQQQQHQTHQMTQIQSNTQQSTTLTPVRLPAILDGEYFTVTRVEDTNVTVRCQQCQKLLNGNLKSTGNFLSHIKRLHPTLIEKIRCKSNQRKPAMVYIDSMSSDKCSEIRTKRVVIQNKKRCKTEECAAENEESYEHQPADWNDAPLVRRRSEETESTDLSVRIPHNNSFVIEDEYDAIGRNVAAKLRNMRLDQRIIAEKLLNDILFEAQLGNLRRDSSIHV